LRHHAADGNLLRIASLGLIAEGAVRLDDEPVTDPGYLIRVSPGQERKLSLGRKRHGILRSA
jgi:tyrosyl-tRNA synthetase